MYPKISQKRSVGEVVVCCRNQASFHGQVEEIEQQKQKLKQYSDYDEIKRELEIMKVIVKS